MSKSQEKRIAAQTGRDGVVVKVDYKNRRQRVRFADGTEKWITSPLGSEPSLGRSVTVNGARFVGLFAVGNRRRE